jgi:cold shock protein
MATGKVRLFNADKGYGFIAPDAGGVDLFVHISNVADGVNALPIGARVQFNERPSRHHNGKFEAYDVVLCE